MVSLAAIVAVGSEVGAATTDAADLFDDDAPPEEPEERDDF